MRESLAAWIGQAEALRYVDAFNSVETPLWLSTIRARAEDYYIALVGELFHRMRENYTERDDWARLGNALAQFASDRNRVLKNEHIDAEEARLFAAGAYYIGGFPASACLTMRETVGADRPEFAASVDFLSRREFTSRELPMLLQAIRENDENAFATMLSEASSQTVQCLDVGPTEWIHARLFECLLRQFGQSNLRTVLPERSPGFWQPLIESFLDQVSPCWEFFPSQIEALNQGILNPFEAFSMQMPTGAGKTTLCETLFYDHLKSNPNGVAILLVPFRALASELRQSLVKRLKSLGFRATAVYGGTVPIGDETASLEDLQALVATPEALSGLLNADPDFFNRVSLLVCDEGHLLDDDSRGVGLELMLARFKARQPAPPRFVFMSAIIPNIQAINSWLGGSNQSVVRSDYRPAIAEFATLRSSGSGANTRIDLEVNAEANDPIRYRVEDFLDRSRFRYENPETRRQNTYPFSSVKTQTVASARMLLPLGTCAVFASNKTGNQGVIAMAEELLAQLALPLTLPRGEPSNDHSLN